MLSKLLLYAADVMGEVQITKLVTFNCFIDGSLRQTRHAE
jgi:hypothetical protein